LRAAMFLPSSVSPAAATPHVPMIPSTTIQPVPKYQTGALYSYPSIVGKHPSRDAAPPPLTPSTLSARCLGISWVSARKVGSLTAGRPSRSCITLAPTLRVDQNTGNVIAARKHSTSQETCYPCGASISGADINEHTCSIC
jgi:hypothetical protein